ncbi:VOC family protein [Solitalea longa]|uniref:VOC family protein n=1 Tax=Solitalea longa TaxID=2079460 RepID=A0A2S5AAH7_9SPHI|nr:VOC family protein [Solitalea longa]POY39392.1 VOC family protein [Solitalea longa]
MRSTDIYLHFNGNSEMAFSFYRSIFGGEFIAAQRYKDVPGGDKMNDDDQEKMMHISLKITPYTTLMASDIVNKDDSNFGAGNNFHICLHAENEKDADKLFNALSNEGRIEMPMNKTFWGAYFGMCQDKFGIQWMINFTYPQTN